MQGTCDDDFAKRRSALSRITNFPVQGWGLAPMDRSCASAVYQGTVGLDCKPVRWQSRKADVGREDAHFKI